MFFALLPLTYVYGSAQEEDVKLKPEALDVLTRMAVETSLRYTINLITTAHLAAKQRKSDEVDVADVRRVYSTYDLNMPVSRGLLTF